MDSQYQMRRQGDAVVLSIPLSAPLAVAFGILPIVELVPVFLAKASTVRFTSAFFALLFGLVMMLAMFEFGLAKFQVLRPIIRTDAVDVVDDFVTLEQSTNFILHYQTVLHDVRTTTAIWMIARVNHDVTGCVLDSTATPTPVRCRITSQTFPIADPASLVTVFDRLLTRRALIHLAQGAALGHASPIEKAKT